MSWKAIDRNVPPEGVAEAESLAAPLQEKIRALFGRYETKRAALLPALHMVQDDYGYIGWRAMEDLAELLDLTAAEVFDTVTFYTYFWTHPKGRKLVTVCRSISCEVLGANEILAECKRVLGIDEHATTADGQYSLATEECLAACDHAPCLYVNERCYHRVEPGQVRAILEDPHNDRLDVPRSDLFDGVKRHQ